MSVMHGLTPLLTAALLAAAPAVQAATCQPDAGGALTAEYTVHYRPAHAGEAPTPPQIWRLQRTTDGISWRKGDVQELWLRQPNGVRLLRVFHADQQVVDYAPGELSALGVPARWDELASLLPDEGLRALGRQGAQYAGQWQGEQVEVDWDAAAALPGRLVRRSPAGEVRYERTACTAKAAITTDFAGYGRIDAADFGDMAYDPFVRKAQAYDEQRGWRVAHTH